MAEQLFWLFIAVNTLMLVSNFFKPMGVFRYTFLTGCVNLTFVAPQLYAVMLYTHANSAYMSLSLVCMITCTLALWFGFNLGAKVRPNQLITVHNLQYDKIIKTAALFCLVGLVAYMLNRGQYKGGKVSGTFVVIKFFANYINYSLVLVMIALSYPYKKYRDAYKFILFLLVLSALDLLVFQARRANAIYFFLIICYFWMIKLTPGMYKTVRYIIPAFFLVGMFSSTVIAQYRQNSYEGKMSVGENIESMDLSNSREKLLNNENEINNAILGINMVAASGQYDWGGSNWNGIIRDYIPKSFIGASGKQGLMFNLSYSKYTGRLTATGKTMTGYFDAYASFGILGFIKFLIIGYIMGVLWRKKEHSQISLLLYFALLTAALHILTHSTNNFFSGLVFYAVFVYPFLHYLPDRKKKIAFSQC